jgi:hypothetical protein
MLYFLTVTCFGIRLLLEAAGAKCNESAFIIVLMIAFEDASQCIKTKKQLAEALVRNHFKIPASNSKLCNTEFLQAVWRRETLCPKYDSFVFVPCATPPSLNTVVEELRRVLIIVSGQANLDPRVGEQIQNLIEHLDRGRKPDIQWALDVICWLTQGQHQYFQKNYVPPVARTPQRATIDG